MAVIGGTATDFTYRNDGEAFDPQARTWQPLPPMEHARGWHGLLAVAGGLLAVGGAAPDYLGNLPPAELFDEASGRWFELPHPMAQPRTTCSAIPLPAAVLAPAPAAAALPAAAFAAPAAAPVAP